MFGLKAGGGSDRKICPRAPVFATHTAWKPKKRSPAVAPRRITVIGRIPDQPVLAESPPLVRFLANVATALAYFLLAEIALILAEIYGNVAPIWPAAGLALVAVFLCGKCLLPGIFVGSLAANLMTGIDPLGGAAIALGNTSEAAVGLALLGIVRHRSILFDRFSIPLWMLITALLGPIPASVVGTLSLQFLSGIPAPIEWAEVLVLWWMGDAIGILIVAPLLLSLHRPRWSLDGLLKLVAFATVALLGFGLIYLHGGGIHFLFLGFFLLIPACFWFGTMGCAGYTVVFTLFASALSQLSSGNGNPGVVTQEAFVIGLVLLALAVTSLTIATFYRRQYFAVPAVIFAIGWATSFLVVFSLNKVSERTEETRFLEIVEDAENAIYSRLEAYIDALAAGAGFYLNAGTPTPRQWASFVQELKVEERYPGINGMGVVIPMSAHEATDWGAARRGRGPEDPPRAPEAVPQADGLSPSVGAPSDGAATHYVVTRIEPLHRNRGALGLDLAAETRRRAAADRSRDLGRPQMTDRITLVQDAARRPGFLLYYPMYRGDPSPKTVEGRRAAFVGWTSASFITEAFMDGVLGDGSDQIQFDVFDDILLDEAHFVYTTEEGRPGGPPGEETFQHISTLDLAGQDFSFGWKPGPGFLRQERLSAVVAATSVVLGTCLLVAIVVNLQSTGRRANRIVGERTAALEQTNTRLQVEVGERLKAEQAAEASRRTAESANMAKSEFLATMSHEIRTPMNSVIGFADLLANSDLSSEQRVWTSYILSSGNSLLRIINDILDFSKIEAGKLELESVPFSPGLAVKEVVTGFYNQAAEKGLMLDGEVSPDLPATVSGDPIRLKQVISNLVVNAIKFTDSGSVTVRAAWSGTPQNGCLEVEVEDTGIGIQDDMVEKLFSRFTQADSSTTRRYGGTGLGLAICKRILELMGGTIRATSTVDAGTTVYCEVPFEPVQAETATPAEEPTPSPQPPRRTDAQPRFSLSTLVVDDNRVNQKLAQTVLTRFGCEVSLAENGLEALAHVRERRFDIVFIDCRMPVLDGYDAAHKIRELEATGELPGPRTGQRLRIVALTANASEEDRKRCFDCGMDDYIAKPFSAADFEAILKKHTDQQVD